MKMEIKIITCNIRVGGYDEFDGKDSWIYRKELCADVIKAHEPSVICFQEMYEAQFDYLKDSLTDFASYGLIGPIFDEYRHPPNCIFYRRDLFTMVTAGGYWLSESPHVPGSKSWDSTFARIANWVLLRDKATKKELRVVNTHLDHLTQIAREKQAAVIVEDANAYPQDYPQVLTGDMNCDCTNKAMDVFKSGNWLDSYKIINNTENPGYTFHQFLGPKYESFPDKLTDGKMDWVFIRGKAKVVEAEVIKDSRDGRFPSDHYFVSATIQI